MPAMALVDVLGALLTLISLGVLLLGGFLAAVRLLGERAEREPLTLAIASLVATSAIAVGIGLVLGAVGLLRIDLALASAAGLVLALAWGERRTGGERVARAGGILARSTWTRLREHPVLSLITLHAVGSEALRGLFRPPLSWDSLMYHLLLAARWLQDGNLRPVLGPHPTNFYGYNPGNGSIWLWWWMAPSHSELYVNLAYVAQWLLLGLAAGAVARRLGAHRLWPLASFLVLLTPTVVRFVATQYVDIAVGAFLLAGIYFAFRWLDEPAWPEILLAGASFGLAAGTKLLALPFAAAFAGMRCSSPAAAPWASAWRRSPPPWPWQSSWAASSTPGTSGWAAVFLPSPAPSSRLPRKQALGHLPPRGLPRRPDRPHPRPPS